MRLIALSASFTDCNVLLALQMVFELMQVEVDLGFASIRCILYCSVCCFVLFCIRSLLSVFATVETDGGFIVCADACARRPVGVRRRCVRAARFYSQRKLKPH